LCALGRRERLGVLPLRHGALAVSAAPAVRLPLSPAFSGFADGGCTSAARRTQLYRIFC
jgi:hypothetical protein